MRDLIKGLAISTLRGLLRGFWLLPIRQTRVFFSSYEGRSTACNPRAIYEQLRRRHAGRFEAVWCVNDPDKQKALQAEGAQTVRYHSLSYFRTLLTARAVVFNDLQGCSYLPFRRGQFVVQTWHGCGLYKKVGHDVPNQSAGYHARLSWMTRRISLFLSGAQAFSDTVIRGAFGYEGEILQSGLPRNDVLLSETDRAAAARRVRETLGLPADRKLLLYAPTFRDHGAAHGHFLQRADVREAIANILGGEVTCLVRTHYMDALTEKGGAVDVTAYPDMQELLAAADMLVSDYSSCIWDFSLTRRPCFLFADDLSAYQTERDFYLDIHRWPFPLATNEDELLENLRAFDRPSYEAAVAAHLSELGSFETGQASRLAADRIWQALSD
ncbi:MAG: CDP-glycerol glycerophosphotransferase family protein [Clostridia bacterium]|nr:CDP-glycerol glycerophosphotransferase family protein [Clostridia bacterium]